MNEIHEHIEPCPACHVILTRNTEGRPFTSICPPVIEQPMQGSSKWRVHCYSCGSRTTWAARTIALDLWNSGATIPGKPVKRRSWGDFHGDKERVV